MSTISTTPRRPSTAQPSLNTRIPYEAGEALLWERQNHRTHVHLSQQMKELQTQHDAYESRIAATEVVARAAEAAVHLVKELERKVRAVEEEEVDRPLDRWVKEAVGQLQVVVDGLKGVRGKISGLEMKVDKLGEEVEGVRGEDELLEDVVRRLEVLERARDEERDGRGDAGRQSDTLHDGLYEETQDEVLADDNPLAVFYGIDTRRQSPERAQQSPSRRRASPSRRQDKTYDDAAGASTKMHQQDCSAKKPTQSPQRQDEQPSDLLPPDEEIALPGEDDFDIFKDTPTTSYGWENTQQFKDMQRELEELRAMCRSQDPKSNNNTADATQRPQETLIISKENNMGFSDATTETEMEVDDSHHSSPRTGRSRQGMEDLNSNTTLPSSPPKRIETQSARRKLMKRASIHDPRVPSVDEHGDDARVELVQTPLPSLFSKLPVDARVGPGKATSKRKHEEDAPVQRAVRPKLSNDTITAGKPLASIARKDKATEERSNVSSALSNNTTAQPSPTRKTYSKQKAAADRPVQRPAPRTSSRRSEQAAPAVEPVVSMTEKAKTRKAVSKPKTAPKKTNQQPAPAQATASSNTGVVVKKESKGTRQPNGACKTCRARHQRCDRTEPSCGRCTKFGLTCEYLSAASSAVPSSGASTASRKKEKAANEANREHILRGRSVTVSPEAPCQQSPAKRPMPASPLKKPITAATPTAASSRAPRAKNTQASKASTQKKRQK